MTEHQIRIFSMSFVPETITIKQGDSIVWANNDSPNTHNATGVASNLPATGDITPGRASSPQKFDTPSEGIDYICSIHPNMKGKIIVEESSGGGGGTPNPDPLPNLQTDFSPGEWKTIAKYITAGWAYDLADDVDHTLNSHHIEKNEISDDDPLKEFKLNTLHIYEQLLKEWNELNTWWRELTGDSKAFFFDRRENATWESRTSYLSGNSRVHLEELARKLRLFQRKYSPVITRWPHPARPDDKKTPGVMFEGQSEDKFGKAITVNNIDKPFQDAYMDHQNFAAAAFTIDIANDLEEDVPMDSIRNYLKRKKTMSPLHYKLLAMHQYRGLTSLWDGTDLNESEFAKNMWRFCIRGEMDAPQFSWWQWLKWVDAHLQVLSKGTVPHIVDLPEGFED